MTFCLQMSNNLEFFIIDSHIFKFFFRLSPMLHASKSFEENNLMPSITTDFVFNYSDIELKNSPIDD